MDTTSLQLLFAGLSALATAAAAVAGFFSWRSARLQHDLMRTQWSWEAASRAELEADSPAFLEVHGIDQEPLDRHKLSADTLRAYLLVANMAWRSRLANSRFNKLNRKKFSTFEEGVNYILKEGVSWDEGYMTRVVLESEGFAQAWPLVSRFWVRSPTAKTTQLIQASVIRGRRPRRLDRECDGPDEPISSSIKE